MVRLRRLSVVIISSCVLAACNRNGKLDSESVVSIQVPHAGRMLSSIPLGRTQCFGINVTGNGITPTNGDGCTPQSGILAGYVSAGGIVSANVPKNLTVNIDLYLYLLPQGQGACPGLSASIPSSQLGDTFLIGSATGVSTANDTTNVNIVANYPSNGANITQQLNMSATCQALAIPSGAVTPFTVSSGAASLSGTAGSSTIHLDSRVGVSYGAKTLSGGSLKLIVR
jgi:hypothetical protein